jgi:hypothetical protein
VVYTLTNVSLSRSVEPWTGVDMVTRRSSCALCIFIMYIYDLYEPNADDSTMRGFVCRVEPSVDS